MTGPFQIAQHAGITRLCMYPMALTIVGAAFASPWRVGVVNGKSMNPTLKPGSVMIYDTHYYANHPIQAGDVVLLKWGGETWVKRVYGVPDTMFLAVREHLNGGERNSNTPIKAADLDHFERFAQALRSKRQDVRVVAYRVLPGHVFVMGDGPGSIDSRSVGQIPMEQILGKVTELPGQDLHRDARDAEWSWPESTAHRG